MKIQSTRLIWTACLIITLAGAAACSDDIDNGQNTSGDGRLDGAKDVGPADTQS